MRETFKRSRGWSLALILVIAAFGAAACGDNNNSSSAGGGSDVAKGEGIRAGTGSRADQAKAAGEKLAAEAGGTAKVPTGKTIGIINFLGGIESSDRLKSTSQLAAKRLGWKSIVCDGKGTPAQFVACGNSLLDRGVDAIFEIAIEPSQIQSVLTKAKAKNVPVFQVGGGAVPNGDLDGNYGPNEAKAGQVLSDEVFKRLGSSGGDVIIHDFPAAWAKVRTDQFRKAVKEDPRGVKIAANTVTDAANLVQFTRKTVTDQITQYPKAKLYWFTFDTTGQVGGQVLASKYAGKQPPDRPYVATFHADLGTLDLMRQGAIDFTSEANYDAAVWIAADQLVEHWARHTEISKENQPVYGAGVGDLFTYQIIDKTNLPPKGSYVDPKWDVPSLFQAKWSKEFGV